MGELYLAASGARGMEKFCVIKTVLPGLVAMENAQRFRDEAMVVVRLSHGNLVTVFDAGRNDNQIYLAMEYVDGKDLLAVWNRCAQKRVPFPVDVAAYIVKELARGLGYAHAFGGLKLVHRDVSPANVLVSYTGEVKLTDFGLARSTLKHQHTAPGIIFGKLSYLAPEQARSETLDGRTDIYAAGILLWELLTGQQLFPVKQPAADAGEDAKRDSTADALARVRNPQVMLPSHVTPRVPPELDAIVMRALAPEPSKRYQTGEELRADLAAFLAATTPETDAARLAAFLRPLFHDLAEKERDERDLLMRGAAGLLSGAFSAEVPQATLLAPDQESEAAALAAAPPRARDRTPGRRDTDLAPLGVPGGRRAGDATPLGRDGGGVKGSGVRQALSGEDPRVGATLGGRYFIERLCGEGAMGRVYEARHIDIGRRLAIKILHSSYRHSEEVVERFRREARAASKIGHPNIVDVTDSGMTPDGAFYFVMEYLDGVDLEQLIQREGALPVDRALLITAQLCRALQAAHASEIIHRDLKPANVMLVNRKDDDDFVKVLDFGISRNMELEGGNEPGRKGLTRPDVAVGTPVYMSPEQAAGMRADALTDVYAVGGLLYEMLTATPPCAGDDVLTVLNKKATEDPPAIGTVRPELPVDVQRLVMRALSRAPRDRQPSMAALKEDVLRCLAGGQEATAPVSPELRRPSGPRPNASVVMAEPAEPRRPVTERLVLFRAKPWMLGAGAVALVALMALVSLVRRESREQAGAGEGDEVAIPAVAAAPPTPPAAPVAEPIAAPALPPQEPVNLKKAARVVEPAPAKPEATAPALAAPWPAESPPVFAQPKAAAKRAPGAPAAPPAKPAAAADDELPSANAAPPPAPSGDEILARGQAAFDRGNYPEAIRRAKEAIAVGATVPGHLLLADAYFHIQRYSDALREYETTLQLEPTNTLARRGRELAEKAGSAGH
jgi:serine/threonine-protein kinase